MEGATFELSRLKFELKGKEKKEVTKSDRSKILTSTPTE
jgi:hypothetical protein